MSSRVGGAVGEILRLAAWHHIQTYANIYFTVINSEKQENKYFNKLIFNKLIHKLTVQSKKQDQDYHQILKDKHKDVKYQAYFQFFSVSVSLVVFIQCSTD